MDKVNFEQDQDMQKIDISKLNIDELLEHMRGCISYFCLEDCYSHCCQKRSFKTKDPAEVQAIFGLKDSKEIIDVDDYRLKIKDFSLKDTEYFIQLDPCPQLDKRLCKIYDNPERPAICRIYPVIKNINLKTIILSETCPAFLEGLFEPYYQEIEKRGYKIKSVI